MKVGDYVIATFSSPNHRFLGQILEFIPNQKDSSKPKINVKIFTIGRRDYVMTQHEVEVISKEQALLWKLENNR